MHRPDIDAWLILLKDFKSLSSIDLSEFHKLQPDLEELKIGTGVEEIEMKDIHRIVSTFNSIQKLELDAAAISNRDKVDVIVPLFPVRTASGSCAMFPSLHTLQCTIRNSGAVEIQDTDLSDIAKACPNLVDMLISGVGMIMDPAELQPKLRLLKSLKLENIGREFTTDVLLTLKGLDCKLESLELSMIFLNLKEPEELKKFLEYFQSSLKSLCVTHAIGFIYSQPILPCSLAMLEKLKFSLDSFHQRFVDDWDWNEIFSQCPKLKSVAMEVENADSCRWVLSAIVSKELCSKMIDFEVKVFYISLMKLSTFKFWNPPLTKLILQHCENLHLRIVFQSLTHLSSLVISESSVRLDSITMAEAFTGIDDALMNTLVVPPVADKVSLDELRSAPYVGNMSRKYIFFTLTLVYNRRSINFNYISAPDVYAVSVAILQIQWEVLHFEISTSI